MEFPWYKSQVLQSQVVAFVMALAAFFNYTFDFDINEAVVAIFAGIGALMAIWASVARLFKPNPNLTATADNTEKRLAADGTIPLDKVSAGNLPGAQP